MNRNNYIYVIKPTRPARVPFRRTVAAFARARERFSPVYVAQLDLMVPVVVHSRRYFIWHFYRDKTTPRNWQLLNIANHCRAVFMAVR